jgi:hypothetical protein
MWALNAFVETGKEGGGGIQHGSSVSADDERQEQYPGCYISTAIVISAYLSTFNCQSIYIDLLAQVHKF